MPTELVKLFMRVSGGNPGAITALTEVKKHFTDEEFFAMATWLDQWGIDGGFLWDLYKYTHNFDAMALGCKVQIVKSITERESLQPDNEKHTEKVKQCLKATKVLMVEAEQPSDMDRECAAAIPGFILGSDYQEHE